MEILFLGISFSNVRMKKDCLTKNGRYLEIMCLIVINSLASIAGNLIVIWNVIILFHYRETAQTIGQIL